MQALLKEREVIRVNETIERLEEQQKMGSTRRHLLSTSVRLSQTMSPKLHKMADHCGEALGLELPLELYAFSSPQFNAACFKPEEGRLYIMFSSSLLEAFDDKELLYVLGHELGHHIYNHHEVPIGMIVRGKEPPPARLALELFTWSRYAEVSADRAGALCANDFNAVARALFKLASGITKDDVVQFNLEEFMRQVDEMEIFDNEPGRGAPKQDWFSTHPFSPLRVKALQHFFTSDLMQPEGFDKDELELLTQGTMSLMEPDYIEGKTDSNKAMRSLFIAGAVAVADARDGISEAERTVLQSFFDETFDVGKLDADRLEEALPKRIDNAMSDTSPSQRMQVLRDICVVAMADKPVCKAERKVLRRLAKGLDVPWSFVLQHLEPVAELD